MGEEHKSVILQRNCNFPYSLHDSRVKKITFHNKVLTLKVDRIFEYTDNEERIYRGEIRFKDCDLDLCEVLVFNKTLGKGRFTGKAVDLEEFMDRYKEAEFEIITEGYHGYNTTYTGWLWEDGKNPVSAVMYIWNSGDLIYHIHDEL